MTTGWESLNQLEIQFKPRGCSKRVSLATITPGLESPKAPNLPPVAEVKGGTDCTSFPFDCRLRVLSTFPSNFVDRGAYYCVAVYNKTDGGTDSLEFGVNVDQTFVEDSQSHTDHIFSVTVVDVHKLVVAWNRSEWAGVTEASVVRMTLDGDGGLAERPRSLFRVVGQQSIAYGNVGVLLARHTPISTPAQQTKRSSEDEIDEVLDSRSIEITQSVYVLKDSCHEKCPQSCYVCQYVFSCELNHPRCIGEDAKLCFCQETDVTGGDGSEDFPLTKSHGTSPVREASSSENDDWSAARPLAVLMVFFLLLFLICLVLGVLHRSGRLCGNKYARELLCCPGGRGRHTQRRREPVHSSPSRSVDRDGGRSSESPGEEGRSFLPSSTD
nr:hypothetical protein BaRGS_028610 [Batillaria attramentaria]